jgi:hypothetical protein
MYSRILHSSILAHSDEQFWCVVHIFEYLKNAAKNCTGHLHVSKCIDIDRELHLMRNDRFRQNQC